MNKSKGFNSKIIAITRPQERAQSAVTIVKDNEGIPLVVPTLELEAFPSESLMDLCSRARNLDWMIFTSPASLESLFKYCENFKEKLIQNVKLRLLDPAQRILNEYGLKADIVPEDYTAEGLLEKFQRIKYQWEKYRLPPHI